MSKDISIEIKKNEDILFQKNGEQRIYISTEFKKFPIPVSIINPAKLYPKVQIVICNDSEDTRPLQINISL